MPIIVPGMISIDYHASGSARIRQNVLNLLNCENFEIKFDPTAGIDARYVDSLKFRGLLATQLMRMLRIKEPRVKVDQITFSDDDTNYKVVVSDA